MGKNICKICGKEVNNVGVHVSKAHSIKSKDYYDKFYKKNKDGICCSCGCETKFISIDKGYNKYCRKCRMNSEETKNKRKNTCLEKYGFDNAAKSKQVQDKMKSTTYKRYGVENVFSSDEIKEKIKKSNLDKYGTEYASKSEQVKNKIKATNLEKYGCECVLKNSEIKDRIAKTNLDKYGSECVFGGDSIKEKIKATNLERYGCDNAIKSEYVKNKIRATNIERYNTPTIGNSKCVIEKRVTSRKEGYRRFAKSNDCTPIRDVFREYGNFWYINNLIDFEILTYKDCKYIPNKCIPAIKKFYEKTRHSKRSLIEVSLCDFIESIYDGVVLTNKRNIINKELDIYIPEKNLAIEFNGLYYHSYNDKESASAFKNSHINKTDACNKIGIRLIHIFEDEWLNKQDVCKSIITSALGLDNRIYARDCLFSKVSNKEAYEFLEANHLQGKINASEHYGLYYKGELVQIISIGKSRFENGRIELLRMCNKCNITVVGGFSKLIKHQPHDSIITYCDLSKFNGDGYIKSGFVKIGMTEPSYFYTKADGTPSISRYIAQKHKLPNIIDNFDKDLTEMENMFNNGYRVAYNCGNLKLIWNRS